MRYTRFTWARRIIHLQIAAGLLSTVAAISWIVSPSRAETLGELVGETYQSNPSLEAERARQRASDEAVPQALSGWRPTVNIEASVTSQDRRFKLPVTHTNLDQSRLSINLSQPVFRGFRTINATRQAEAEVRAGQEGLLDTQQQVLLAAATAYIDVVRDRQILNLRNQNVLFLTKELSATKSRKEEGELTRTDVDQAKTRFYQGKANLALSKSDLANSEAQFTTVTGRRPGRLSRSLSVRSLLPRTYQEALSIALEENPQIIAAKHRWDAAGHEIDVIRGELLPTVSFNASYTEETEKTVLISEEETRIAELRLTMPLYNAGTTYSRIRQARATYEQRKYEIDNTIRTIKRDVQSSWQQRLSAGLRIAATRKSLSAARSALKGVKIESKVGERSIFDILDAQRDVVTAQLEEANAQRDFEFAGFSLLSAIGRLTAENLDLNVSFYDAHENINAVRYQPFGTKSWGSATSVENEIEIPERNYKVVVIKK